MPYPSIDLLAAAAADLTDRHPLSVITIPALLRTAHKTNTSPLELLPFGSKAEREDLEAFRVSQNDRTKPYLAAWGDPPQLVNADYCGSTLQRFRTQDSLGRSILNDDYSPQTGKRKKFSLKPDAGAIFAQSKYAKVNKLSLAAWLGRRLPFTHVDELMAWFDET